jgi:hypothetical protein
MNSVKVIFDNKENNYTTSVSSKTTKESAKKYFVGTSFNIAPYPYEIFEECISIEFINQTNK